ncbi:cytochrome P450 2C15-like [Ixodes scapularis]|uniref:cytochrome P450 2C15-like n=1 Tax=Ixodes scapularis TaxID=6945 RepID=UPI001C38CF0D|nr:cytochrome P450 2C15-like [Ixodes scapularis]
MSNGLERIRVGTANIVALNSYDSIKNGLSNSAIQGRSRSVFLDQSKSPGIATLNGKVWLENRQMCLKLLRELGMGKACLDEKIRDEVRCLLSQISELKGEPVFISKYTTPSISNNITGLLFGRRYDFDDPRRVYLDENMDGAGKALSSGSLVMFLPTWVYTIGAHLPLTRIYAIKRCFANIVNFTRSIIFNARKQLSDSDEHASVAKLKQNNKKTLLEVRRRQDRERTKEYRLSLDETYDQSFIKSYLEKTTDHQKRPSPYFKPEYIPGHVQTFFGAGTNTINRMVLWHLLNCADKPDSVQKRIQAEIDEVIGQERQPTWEDRHRMPFTAACVWEMHRWKPVSPLGIPRGAEEDTEIDGYFIPKGTVVIGNIWAVHMDRNLWKKPEEFDPTRFLDQTGTKILPKPDYLIAFSVGKRMCPSEALSSSQIFVYVTSILQKFSVHPEDDTTQINLITDCVTFNTPKPQKLRFIRR